MPAQRELVDVEALAVAHVAAAGTIAGDRVATTLDAYDPALPTVKLNRVGGAPVDGGTEHVDRAIVDVHAYAPDSVAAWTLAAETLAALRTMPGAEFAGAAVSAVERVTGPRWAPDPSTDPPAARYLLTVAITVHPTA